MHLASHAKFSTRVLNFSTRVLDLVLNLVARVKTNEQADEHAIHSAVPRNEQAEWFLSAMIAGDRRQENQ